MVSALRVAYPPLSLTTSVVCVCEHGKRNRDPWGGRVCVCVWMSSNGFNPVRFHQTKPTLWRMQVNKDFILSWSRSSHTRSPPDRFGSYPSRGICVDGTGWTV